MFCLEPEGDWPTRSGIVQDFLLGCIPVLFSQRQHENMWRSAWPIATRQNTSVRFDAADVLAGRIDPIRALQAIPAARVRQMQRACAAARQGFTMIHAKSYLGGSRVARAGQRAYDCADDQFTRVLRALRDSSRKGGSTNQVKKAV